MALTPDIIKQRFPEFSLVPDTRIEMAILEATIVMGDNVDRWLGQGMYYMANSYLVAHLTVVMQNQATGDDSAMYPVRGTEVDDVVVDFAVNSIDLSNIDAEFYSTSYGKRFLLYRSMCFTGGISV